MSIAATVTPVGTPLLVRATAGAVTGSWGAGQNRTAGNQLVAIVTAGGTTASAAALNIPAGWFQQALAANDPAGGVSLAWAAVYTRIATGADAAPAFTATLTGTVAMTCTLLELIAVDVAACFFNNGTGVQQYFPQDIAGTYSSGTSSATLSSVVVAAGTGQVTATPGEYAVTVVCQEAAAAANTWNGPGGAWANLVNDGATSSVLHTAIDVRAPVPAGTALTETGYWTADTSAFAAGIIMSFAPQVYGVFAYANEGSTTITAGGTDAPAAGTPEFWTAASWASFPVAAPAASPPTCFHVSDPAAASETILVLNTASGLVIRGADGTTPVAHAGGFTIQNVISSSDMSDDPGQAIVAPPPTGVQATDSSNIRTALRAAMSMGRSGTPAQSGTCLLLNGVYQLDVNQLAIPSGVNLMLSSCTVLTVNCTAGSAVDAITIGHACALEGATDGQGIQAVINAVNVNCRTVISNAYHSIQEFAVLRNVAVTLAGASATLGVAVVEMNGVFVNSGIRDVNIFPGTINTAGTAGLLITGSPSSGFGPLYVDNIWVDQCNGPCMKVTENNPQQGACVLWMKDVDLEHPVFPYHNLDIEGFGGLISVVINGLHTENVNTTTSGHVAGVYINGASNVIIDGYSILASNVTNKYAVWIASNANNARITVNGLSNINGVIPAIQDDTIGYGLQDWWAGHYTGPGQSAAAKYQGSMVLQGDLELGSQSVALASTSVNAVAGNIIDVAALAASVVVAAPASPVNNQLLIYKFVQNGTGGFAVTWNAIFRVAAGVVSAVASKASVVAFRYDASLTAWVQLWATTGV